MTRRFLWLAILLLGSHLDLLAGPKVEIVTNVVSPSLEHTAAEELAGHLRRLYQAEVSLAGTPSDPGAHVIFVGSPSSNPETRDWSASWPKLSDQGHCLKTVNFRGQPALLVGGETPAATFWAVSELAHRLGIRSLLYGDLDPATPPAFKLTGYDVVREPQLRSRAWRTIDDFPIGQESWGLQEQKQVVKQLAKQKYNRLLLSVHSWQPFVDFEFGGVKKQTGVLWYGLQYPVGANTAGRSAFAGAKLFENPDFTGRKTYQERIEAGTALLQGIIKYAHEMGMTVGLVMSPLEFPKEFFTTMPQAKLLRGENELSIGPGPLQMADDEVLMQIAKTQLRAYLGTYPEVDAVYLSLPKKLEWSEHAESSWNSLSQRSGPDGLPSLLQLTDSARHRLQIGVRKTGDLAFRSHLVGFDFLTRLRSDSNLFLRPDGQPLEVNFLQIDPDLFACLDKLTPTPKGQLRFVDYTARQVAQNENERPAVAADLISDRLILILTDDNTGFLPQASHKSLERMIAQSREKRWAGYCTDFLSVGDFDLSSYFLSRASFDPDITSDQACHDMVSTICGDGIAVPVIKALRLIEEATTLIAENDVEFSSPIPNIVMKHYEPKKVVPAWWGQVRDHYQNAMNEMYRANTRARVGGRSYVLYHARRAEFGWEYMNSLESLAKAGIARQEKNAEEQQAQLQAAVNSMYNALNALAVVARSNSDRGIIALLNEYGYRRLTKELEAVEREFESR